MVFERNMWEDYMHIFIKIESAQDEYPIVDWRTAERQSDMFNETAWNVWIWWNQTMVLHSDWDETSIYSCGIPNEWANQM